MHKGNIQGNPHGKYLLGLKRIKGPASDHEISSTPVRGKRLTKERRKEEVLVGEETKEKRCYMLHYSASYHLQIMHAVIQYILSAGEEPGRKQESSADFLYRSIIFLP